MGIPIPYPKAGIAALMHITMLFKYLIGMVFLFFSFGECSWVSHQRRRSCSTIVLDGKIKIRQYFSRSRKGAESPHHRLHTVLRKLRPQRSTHLLFVPVLAFVFFGGFFLPPGLVVGLPPSVGCPIRRGLVWVSLVRLTGVLPSLCESQSVTVVVGGVALNERRYDRKGTVRAYNLTYQ